MLKIWNWYFGKQENASKTFWLTFHLFLVLLQNQLCQNIPVTLLQLCQWSNPSAPEAPLFGEFWIQSLQFLLNISKGGKSTNLPRYRKYFVSSATFHAHFREDTSDFFSFLLDCCTRCPDSTGALNWLIARCWCSRFLFSLFAGFIFSSCWSFCLPFLWCCQPRLFDFCHRMCSSSLNKLKGYHPFHHPSLFCSEALNLYSHNICTGKLAFLFQSCLNSVYKQSDWWKHCEQCRQFIARYYLHLCACLFFFFQELFHLRQISFPFFARKLLEMEGCSRDFCHDIFSESQPWGDRLWPPEARHWN